MTLFDVNSWLSPRAQQIIQEIVTDTAKVHFTHHARERMSERDITFREVINCLSKGNISEGPARSIRKGTWEMTFKILSAGEQISVVVALDSDEQGNYIIVITVFN